LRVVLDTNILISAFVFPGGVPELVYRAALEGRITLLTSPPLLAEFGRVLSERFDWDSSRARDAVAQVSRIGVVVRPSERVDEIEGDPTDDRVLEAAVTGGAQVIVSDNRHLLRLKEWREIRIEKAAAFLGALDAT
jgi:uncharacterized protein